MNSILGAVVRVGVALAWVGALMALSPMPVQAQSGPLSAPLSPPSPNAALHYQRALLLMPALDEHDQRILDQNTWEVIPADRPDRMTATRVRRLLYRGRDALNAAAKGSRLTHCDFGIDFSDAGAATLLPHAEPMVRLGRMLVLRGRYAQSQGQWEEAAQIYFDGLRMGRHLNQQATLLEAMAGMQILESNYHALARWAVACPEPDRVARVFGMFEMLADDLVRPAHTMASETSVLAFDFAMLRRSYPEGPWGSAILTLLGQSPGDDETSNREAAVKACVDAGVDASLFESPPAFLGYLASLERLEMRFAEAAANAMRLPAAPRVRRGQQLYQRYTTAAGPIGETGLLDPAEIGALFAGHQAQIVALRVTLAVAAVKKEGRFPKDLESIRSGFGGSVPVNPYDQSPLQYRSTEEGTSFQVSIPAVTVVGYTLPAVEFSSGAPAPAPQGSDGPIDKDAANANDTSNQNDVSSPGLPSRSSLAN